MGVEGFQPRKPEFHKVSKIGSGLQKGSRHSLPFWVQGPLKLRCKNFDVAGYVCAPKPYLGPELVSSIATQRQSARSPEFLKF